MFLEHILHAILHSISLVTDRTGEYLQFHEWTQKYHVTMNNYYEGHV